MPGAESPVGPPLDLAPASRAAHRDRPATRRRSRSGARWMRSRGTLNRNLERRPRAGPNPSRQGATGLTPDGSGATGLARSGAVRPDRRRAKTEAGWRWLQRRPRSPRYLSTGAEAGWDITGGGGAGHRPGPGHVAHEGNRARTLGWPEPTRPRPPDAVVGVRAGRGARPLCGRRW